MAVPSIITDLSSTVASNSPGGSDVIGGNLDNYLRAHAGIARQESLNKVWIPYGEAVTYVSATSFTVVEATAGGSRWYMGRPFKATVTAGVITGVIATTSVSGGTRTVNVISDTALDSGLSRIDLASEAQPMMPTTNYVLNPMFRFWQRNTSFSLTASANATKVCDGWLANSGSATGTATVSRQAHTAGQIGIPFEPTYLMRWDQTLGSSAAAPYMKHNIESVRTLAGRTATLTVLCKLQTAGTLAALTPTITQDFGSGGSPSSSVVTTGSNFLPVSTFRFFTFVLQIPSITGKTIGTTAGTDNLAIKFVPSVAGATFAVDFAGVWLNEGSTPVIATPDSYDVEFARCQRRYYKTFNVDQVPAQNVGDHYSASVYTAVRAGANVFRYMHFLPYPMRTEDRASQSITFYSPYAASATFYNVTGTANSGSGAQVANTWARNFVLLSNNQAAGDAVGDQVAVHFTLDAEYTT